MVGGWRGCGCGWGGGKQRCLCPDESHARYLNAGNLWSHSSATLTFTWRKWQRSNWVQGPDLAQTYQKTLHPQGTARQWLSEEARQLCIVLLLWTSGPEFEWVSWARGQRRMKTRCCAEGQLGHTHATHPSKWRWQLISQIKQTQPSC